MQQQNHPNASRLVPMSNYDVTELKLENSQLAMHGLGGLPSIAQPKPTWSRSRSRSRACDTLESIVHQATSHKHDPNVIRHDQTPANISSMVASSGGTWTDSSVHVPPVQGWIRKRTQSDAGFFENNFSSKTNSIHEEHPDPSSCASPSASVRLCRDNDTTIPTLVSFESPASLKTKSTDEDSACHGGLQENRDDGRETTKGGERSHSTRPRRAAAVHNQSERKRRDRINQKMKALQTLVPNASKTDKASMLDEVIKYLQQLQAQVQMMHSMRNYVPGHMNMNMMMPLEIQQQQQQHLHQMSLLTHMGMGSGTHIHPTPVVAAAPPFMPHFMMPPLMPPHPPPQAKPEPTGSNNGSDPLPDPYCALLAQQSMNMDLFNRMAALYRQQVTPATAASSSPSQSKHVRRN